MVYFAYSIMTTKSKKSLKKLIGFKFDRVGKYRLSSKRLKIIEQFIQRRITTFMGV